MEARASPHPARSPYPAWERALTDGLDALEMLCKAYRVLSFMIGECREYLQDSDREGVSVLLDRLTESVEEWIERSWEALRKEEHHD